MRWFKLLALALLGLLVMSTAVTYADDAKEDASGDDSADSAEEVSPHKERLKNVKAENFAFEAEVTKLLDIVVRSIYSSREIFLRELISNASDALDKIRFKSLTNPKALETSKDSELNVKIQFDKEKRILTITDNGVGMTKAELVKHLGTIAHSGTKNFLDKLNEGNDGSGNNLIGQFGVGFYSAFIVADTVEVTSKSNDDPQQWVWVSASDGQFSIYEDPDGDTLGRGTRISLHLKDDADEYLEIGRLRSLISKFSQFIDFPIHLWTSSEVEEEIPDNSEPEAKKEGEDEDDVKEVDDEEDDKEKKTKKVKKTVWDWERVNESRPVWTRSPEDVSDEDYNSFYKTISKDYQEPMAHTHFVAEGEMEFRAILYVPKDPPRDMFEAEGAKNNMKLYVKRVFIKDENLDLLPRYLNFIRGVVDSNDLPLNVSREMLQQSKTLKVIRKKLVRKALEMFKQMAEAEKKAEEEGEDSNDSDSEEDKEKKSDDKKEVKYLDFWKAYGKNIKLGLIEDSGNKTKLSKLLRFETSKSDKKYISLDKYIENMKDGQESIYYISGGSREAVETSPFLEKLKAHDMEVLYFIDPIDEYAAQTLTEYDGKKLINISKEGSLKLNDADEEELEKKRIKAYEKKYKPLADYIKEKVGSKLISKVTVSERIAESPAVIVASKYGYSAEMEKIVKAQALQAGNNYVPSSKMMEINPRHPIVRRLAELVASEPDSEATSEAAHLLYDTALLTSGFTLEDTAAFSKRMQRALRAELNVDASEALGDDAEIDAAIAKEEEEEAKKKAEEDAKDEGDDEDDGDAAEEDEDDDGDASAEDEDKDEL